MNATLTEAQAVADLGIRVFPCRFDDKRPAVNAWPDVATTESEQIVAWFGENVNLAARCGATTIGVDFFVVDIDIKEDQPGKESWANFCEAHPEVGEAARNTVMVRTPSGGWHFWFVVPEGVECPRNGRPFPGVDIRGEGGYVLIPPSTVGGARYEWVRNPWDIEVAEAPMVLIDALRGDQGGTGDTARSRQGDDRSPRDASGPHPTRSRDMPAAGSSPDAGTRPHTSERCSSCELPLSADGSCATPACTRHGKPGSIDLDDLLGHGSSSTVPRKHHTSFDDDPKEWAKQNFSVYDYLIRNGWVSVKRRGDSEEMQLPRPGKKHDEGSATFHHDSNILNTYTTRIPLDMERIGAPHRGGGVTINGFDAWMLENGYTNVAEAMSAIRKQLMPSSATPVTQVAGPESPPAAEKGTHPHVTADLNLPDEFWESRDWLRHVRTAAWSMKTSPDAVLASVLTRYAADIHPSIQLPEWGTLDLFVVIAGPSGRFKSKASKTARKLYPGRGDAAVMHDYNVGSGEAVAETFFEWRDEDGEPCSASKKGARKVQTKWGLHFATDEGVALTATAGRMGSILIPTLCSAWMGEAIGQVLADPTKSRMIEPHSVRVCAEVKIQTVHGYKLFDEAYASTGLSQRMVCVSSIDPTIKERGLAGGDVPAWPGELDLPYPHLLTGGQERIIDVAPSIRQYLDQVAWEGHDYEMTVSALDTHADLSRLKLSALLALCEDRFAISEEDWELARMILNTHRAVRAVLQATRSQAQRDASHSRNMAEAERAVVVDDARHKALLRRTLQSVEARIEADKPLGKKYMSPQQREVYEEVMQILEAQGLVKADKGGWVKA